MKFTQERVDLGDRSYTVTIHTGLPKDAVPLLLEKFGVGSITVVTDENVGALYGQECERALAQAGLIPTFHTVSPGEESKSMEVATDLLGKIIEDRPDRTRPIIGLGGGVIGDLAGFIASVYLRGVPTAHIATTLLSQVDSSVGGKTGLNHEGSKNLIGTFHQPSLVFCALGALKTLEKREFRSGLAEMLKAGIIRDATLIQELLTHGRTLEDADPAVLLPLVTRSVAIKARIVEEDEREGGVRALLNFGHTFGHALEAADGLGKWAHGEAVAIGMVAAAHVSCGLGLAEADLPQKITHLLEKMGLPVSCENTPGWKEALLKDKKARGKDVLFVGLNSLAQPKIIQISLKLAIFWIEMGLFGYSTEAEGVHHDES